MFRLPTMNGLYRAVRSERARRWLIYSLYNAYPPHRGAGIWLEHVSADRLTLRTAMKLRPWNRNFVGTHYGGSLYAMCDAPFMLILIDALGPEYIVWDKAAEIRFKRPGRGKVRAEFRIAPETIDELRRILATAERHEATFRTQVTDEAGEVVAEIEKRIHLRRKDAAPADRAVGKLKG